MATIEELRDEERRARHVRMIVDFTSNVIMQSSLARSEAERLVVAVRTRVLQLFPGRDQTFDLVYAPRFRRLLDEFTRPDLKGPGAVIPFQDRGRPEP